MDISVMYIYFISMISLALCQSDAANSVYTQQCDLSRVVCQFKDKLAKCEDQLTSCSQRKAKFNMLQLGKYMIFNMSRTWQEARHICASFGGGAHLVSIDTEEELSELKDTIELSGIDVEKDCNLGEGWATGFWTGARRHDTLSLLVEEDIIRYRWEATLDEVKTSLWHAGEPNEGYDCAHMWHDPGFNAEEDLLLADQECHHQICFICEFPAEMS